MPRNEVVTEGELGMPGAGFIDDVDVSRDNEFARSERPNDLATGFVAGAE